METANLISGELVEMSKLISCHFVDAKATSKQYVKETMAGNPQLSPGREGFYISTCLRSEYYCFEPGFRMKDFFYTEKSLCVRRLLEIMAGLQSEIIGEKEILLQVSKDIDRAYHENKIPDRFYKGCQDLLAIARKIRTDCCIETDENYSTIGASLLKEHLQKAGNPTLLIIGGGYMIESFLASLVGARINNITWANRSYKKLSVIVENFPGLATIPKKFIPLDKVSEHTPEADAVFAAISGDTSFPGSKFKPGCYIIDVSYPPVFEESTLTKQMNLSNTFFSDYVEKKTHRKNIEQALQLINQVIHEIDDQQDT